MVTSACGAGWARRRGRAAGIRAQQHHPTRGLRPMSGGLAGYRPGRGRLPADPGHGDRGLVSRVRSAPITGCRSALPRRCGRWSRPGRPGPGCGPRSS